MRSNSRKNARRGALTGPVTVRVDLNGRSAWEIAIRTSASQSRARRSPMPDERRTRALRTCAPASRSCGTPTTALLLMRSSTVTPAGGHLRSHAQELGKWLTPTLTESRDRHHRPAMSRPSPLCTPTTTQWCGRGCRARSMPKQGLRWSRKQACRREVLMDDRLFYRTAHGSTLSPGVLLARAGWRRRSRCFA